jgi:hypothetical protein
LPVDLSELAGVIRKAQAAYWPGEAGVEGFIVQRKDGKGFDIYDLQTLLTDTVPFFHVDAAGRVYAFATVHGKKIYKWTAAGVSRGTRDVVVPREYREHAILKWRP